MKLSGNLKKKLKVKCRPRTLMYSSLLYERFNFYFTRDLPYILYLIYTRTHVKKITLQWWNPCLFENGH